MSVVRVGTGAGAMAAGVGASGRGSVSAGIEALTGMRMGAGAGGAGVSAEAGAEVGKGAVEVEGAWAVHRRIVVWSAGTSTKNRGFLAPARPGRSEASAGDKMSHSRAPELRALPRATLPTPPPHPSGVAHVPAAYPCVSPAVEGDTQIVPRRSSFSSEPCRSSH